MTRSTCLLQATLAGALTCTACAPAHAPAANAPQRFILAQAAPAPSAPPRVAPDAPAEPPIPALPASGPPPSSSATTQLPNSTDPRETPQERESRQLGRTWGWTFVSVGAVASLIAIGTSVLMLEDHSTRNSDCNAQKVCSPAGATANTALSDLAGWNTASWIIAAAGVGIGAYLLITHPSDKAAGAQIGIGSTSYGPNLQLRGSF